MKFAAPAYRQAGLPTACLPTGPEPSMVQGGQAKGGTSGVRKLPQNSPVLKVTLACKKGVMVHVGKYSRTIRTLSKEKREEEKSDERRAIS